MVFIFNWLALKSFETDIYRWKFWHYLVALWCIYFLGTILYGALNILSSVLEFNFIANDTLLYLLLTFVSCTGIIAHIIYYFILNFKKSH